MKATYHPTCLRLGRTPWIWKPVLKRGKPLANLDELVNLLTQHTN